MPSIRPDECWSAWLDPHATAPSLRSVLVPYPSNDPEAVRVGWTVNDVRNDSPACLAPVV